MEDVDEHLQVIDDHPLAGGGTIGGDGTNPVILAEALLDFSDHGLDLWLGVGGAKDEEVGEAGDAAQVEDDDVVGLLARCGGGAGAR